MTKRFQEPNKIAPKSLSAQVWVVPRLQLLMLLDRALEEKKPGILFRMIIPYIQTYAGSRKIHKNTVCTYSDDLYVRIWVFIDDFMMN